MGVGAAVKTDYGKVEAVVRAKNLTIALCRGSYGNAGRADGERAEKFTSCNHPFSL